MLPVWRINITLCSFSLCTRRCLGSLQHKIKLRKARQRLDLFAQGWGGPCFHPCFFQTSHMWFQMCFWWPDPTRGKTSSALVTLLCVGSDRQLLSMWPVSSKLGIPVSISAGLCTPFNWGHSGFGPDHAGSAALLESPGLSYGVMPIASAAPSFHSSGDVQSFLSLVKSKAKQIPGKVMC